MIYICKYLVYILYYSSINTIFFCKYSTF